MAKILYKFAKLSLDIFGLMMPFLQTVLTLQFEQEDRRTKAEIGQQPMGEKRPPAARQHATKTSCLSETYAEDQTKGCPPTCSRQAGPPHSSEESCKRLVSTQYDSIQFCNGGSARDTRPQNSLSCIQKN